MTHFAGKKVFIALLEGIRSTVHRCIRGTLPKPSYMTAAMIHSSLMVSLTDEPQAETTNVLGLQLNVQRGFQRARKPVTREASSASNTLELCEKGANLEPNALLAGLQQLHALHNIERM